MKNISSSLPLFRLRHNRLFPSSDMSLANLRHLPPQALLVLTPRSLDSGVLRAGMRGGKIPDFHAEVIYL